MKLDHIPFRQLIVSPANMRAGRKPPRIDDILPSIRARGILVPLLVRPAAPPDGTPPDDTQVYEIVAGRRRYEAVRALAAEQQEEAEPIPCAIVAAGDDAAAVEASLIENLARLDPDQVSQWETFTRLVREGRTPEAIAATFGLADAAVRRVLALGNLLPRIRDLFRKEQIDAASLRHLTMASKRRQRDWLALHDDPEARAPVGAQLKAWLLGGQSIPARHALFDLDGYAGETVADLFGEDRYFADPDAFWQAQNEAVAARRDAYLDAGWSEVILLEPGSLFHSWDHEKTPKRKGGRVYVEVRQSGEVCFHEGYRNRAEIRRAARGEAEPETVKPPRPEVASALQDYLDLHRHAVVRAQLTGFPDVALRLLVAHAIAGSPLWTVRREPQASRSEAVSESLAAAPAETAFALSRRRALGLLGLAEDEPAVVGCTPDGTQGDRLTATFLHLLALDEAAVKAIAAVAIGETLASGSPVIAALGCVLGVDMAQWWRADEAFLALVRDREVLGAMVEEVAGETVARANAKETGRVLRRIIGDHLAGAEGRPKFEDWVPRWLAFPPAAYTERGGVGAVAAHEEAVAAGLTLPAADGAITMPDAEPCPAPAGVPLAA
ncbi:ParB/RepB/Spo0J family partition protein [Flavisphingomonas formosensis]|uniref:ParB/RepB/Spo0J family partition protein n=1 Tax=Flavisphingomonas formosensis TaxID=861534 RepID=UPI0012F9CE38|nr:ParB/RepB/Spo0J family partition protein [Sphingomonas formosensis]